MLACPDHLNKANTYTGQHFADVIFSEEFLKLGIEQVWSLISSDKFTISSEEKVFEAAVACMNHKDVRQQFMSPLIKHGRIGYLCFLRSIWFRGLKRRHWSRTAVLEEITSLKLQSIICCQTEQWILMKSIQTWLRTPWNFPNWWWWFGAKHQGLFKVWNVMTFRKKDGTKWQNCLPEDDGQAWSTWLGLFLLVVALMAH